MTFGGFLQFLYHVQFEIEWEITHDRQVLGCQYISVSYTKTWAHWANKVRRVAFSPLNNFLTLNFKEGEKNHKGRNLKDQGKTHLMFAQGGISCPIKSLRLYLSQLNPYCSAFF